MKPVRESADPSRDVPRRHLLSFETPSRALDAVRLLRAESFEVGDVFSPFPIHGIEEALGWRETRLPLATLAGAVLGGSVAIGFQLWSHVRDWPLRIGGKSFSAIPALIPVTFELAVLFAAFATVGTLILRSGLRPRVVSTAPDRATDDAFVVVVLERDGAFSPDLFRRMVTRLAPAASWTEAA